jgi:hypothetical protein
MISQGRRIIHGTREFDYETKRAWTPDGSPLVVRDISNQEIYALDWQSP